MPVFRETVRRMEGYVPGEQPRDRRFVKLNTNENPYPPSPKVLDALHDAVDERLRLYPHPFADDLRRRAARRWRLRPENVLIGNGSDDLLAIVFRACVEGGTRVAWPVPTYSLYDTLVEMYGGEAVRIPFREDFSLPRDLVDVDAEVLLLANPNSPSGTLIAPEDVRSLIRPGRLLVIDEAYVEFADTDCLGLLRESEDVVVLRTLSKSHSLAGLRIGFALGAAGVIGTLAKVKDSYNVNRLSIAAGVAALGDPRWTQSHIRRVRETREFLRAGLEELGFRVLPSQANFVLARRPGEDLASVAETLRRRGVLVRYFPTPELRDALRITVGTDEEVRVFLRVLRSILKGREGRGATAPSPRTRESGSAAG